MEKSRDDNTVEIETNESIEGYKSAHSEEDVKAVLLKKIRVSSKESRRWKKVDKKFITKGAQPLGQ